MFSPKNIFLRGNKYFCTVKNIFVCKNIFALPSSKTDSCAKKIDTSYKLIYLTKIANIDIYVCIMNHSFAFR